MNYYNEFDPKAAAWLRELINAGHLPAGEVDERSICDVQPSELSRFTQCHFFAGIGGWSLALKLAGWATDRHVWTGSCPCQPFSAAGKGLGAADPRHLWPQFARLIAECRPAIVFGEQVASAAGRGWLSGIRIDLEGMGYAVGAADLCAASACPEVVAWIDMGEGEGRIPVSGGSPNIRQRLYWLADADGRNTSTEGLQRGGKHGQQPQNGGAGGLVHTEQPGLEGHARNGDNGNQPGWIHAQPGRSTSATGRSGFWDAFDPLPCTDGKTRRIEPGSFPLAHGVPCRVGLLRGYGNAIVPQLAAEFIKAAENLA